MTEPWVDIVGRPAVPVDAPAPRREPVKRPLCDVCRDTAGWIEDEDGRPVERCPCRLGDTTE